MRAALLAVLAGACSGGGAGGSSWVHSVLPPGEPVGAGCGETLDMSHVGLDAAGARARAAQLESGAAAAREAGAARAARAAERRADAERADALARAMNALGEPGDFAVSAAAPRDVAVGGGGAAAAAPPGPPRRCVLCREAMLGAEGGAALARVAAAFEGTTDVAVARSRLGDRGAAAVLGLALDGGASGIRRLTLADDALGDGGCVRAARRSEAAASASSPLERGRGKSDATLETFSLERCGAGAEGVAALAGALEASGAAATLERVSLRGCALCCDGGVSALAGVVAAAPRLAALDLGGTGCGDAGAIALARALAARARAFGGAAAPVAVDVSSNALGVAGVAALASAPGVVALDARGNALGGGDHAPGDAGGALARALAERGAAVERLALCRCGLAPEDVLLLVDALLRRCDALAVLDLSGNALTAAEADRRRAKGENALVKKLRSASAKTTGAAGPLLGSAGAGAPRADALVAAARLLATGHARRLEWLGLSDTGLAPAHGKLFAAATRKRRARCPDAPALEVVALANNAALPKKNKDPRI